jgi:pimeloyl-ACP methyl ester carboxylesterase
VRHPDRVNRLILACTTPGWPFAYPMPLPSVRLIAASQRLAPDEALRRHIENALSAATVADRPELVQQIVDCQRSRPDRDPGAWQAQAAAGGRYAVAHLGLEFEAAQLQFLLLLFLLPHARSRY